MPWPISQRGKDMEDAIKQQKAADLLNLAQLELAKKRSQEIIDSKAKSQ